MKFFILIHVLFSLSPSVHGQDAASSSPNKTLSDFIWQLHDLEGQKPKGNPYLGGQNFSWCCLKALENALDVENNTVVIRNNSRSTIGVGNYGDLEAAAKRNQFPCGARYNGDPHGAPVVAMSYEFLVEQCPGWELSSKNNVNQWLHSLSGFLVPAVIFCLSVPRRRKLYIPRSFFAPDMAGVKSYVPAFLGALAAGLIVLLDTTIWLSICFAFAGPMILSGLYEAMLDSRVIEFLKEVIEYNRLSLHMRCRCLMIILIGNLDLALESDSNPDGTQRPTQVAEILPDAQKNPEAYEPAKVHPDPPSTQIPTPTGTKTPSPESEVINPPEAIHEQQQNLVSGNSQPLQTSTVIADNVTTAHTSVSPWEHMEFLLKDLQFDNNNNNSTCSESSHQSQQQLPPQSHRDAKHRNDNQHKEQRPLTHRTRACIARTKTRLRAMLHCQYSFGTVIGAPVVFFLGGFVFAFLSSLEYLGSEDIAESIAFGSWYMIIPHIAIVSGLLLAGNNPNILEGVFATEREEKDDKDSHYVLFGILRFELVYPSCYKVAWQWQRGNNKKRWINHLFKTYGNKVVEEDQYLEILRARTNLSYIDWFLLLLLTMLLLGVPFILAFLMSFFTPQIGLSCRSGTFALSFCIQVAQIEHATGPEHTTGPEHSAKAEHATGPEHTTGPEHAAESGNATRSARGQRHGFHLQDFFCKGGWLDNTGFYEPSKVDWLLEVWNSQKTVWDFVWSRELWSLRMMWCGIYYFLVTILGFAAIFSSIGGTLMQIMGVYRNALCYINTPYWLVPDDQKPMAVLSTNSEMMLRNAISNKRNASTPALQPHPPP
ncbi:hypothetical protein VTH82DRAFT_6318 [Thermothelomyces myriococcoides]